MKIQHWAIIFILIILPFSIICRNKIQKKMAVLKDETRINNIIDNATYDAVSQLKEIAEQLEYGKNIPITKSVAEAVVDRFFTTMAVNFNLNPIRRVGNQAVDEKDDDYYFGGIITTQDESIGDYFHSSAQEYLSQFVPAVIIVGYDKLFTFSYNNGEYSYVETEYPNGYTLDNFITLSGIGGPYKKILDEDVGVYELKGYVGNFLDADGDGIDDWDKDGDGIRSATADELDPYHVAEQSNKLDFIMNYLPTFTDNLSYLIYVAHKYGVTPLGSEPNYRMYCDPDGTGGELPDFTKVKQDYVYDFNGNITQQDKHPISEFNRQRRHAIITTIRDELNRAFNNQNQYANMMGITYKFYLPEIGMDQWNHTIDDISVLSFVQGLPMGYDGFYNSYSLGGSRIVQSHNFYGETIEDERGLDGVHKVYHKWYCKCLPRNTDGTIAYENNEAAYGVKTKEYCVDAEGKRQPEYPYDVRKNTSHVVQEFNTAQDALEARILCLFTVHVIINNCYFDFMSLFIGVKGKIFFRSF